MQFICLWDSKGFLVILLGMKRAKVSLASSAVHKPNQKKKKRCSLWHRLAGPERKGKSLMYERRKIKTEGAERKGCWHIHFLPFRCSVYPDSFNPFHLSGPFIFLFHLSVSLVSGADPGCRPQGNMGLVLAMWPKHTDGWKRLNFGLIPFQCQLWGASKFECGWSRGLVRISWKWIYCTKYVVCLCPLQRHTHF